jgi:hypothetical protein
MILRSASLSLLASPVALATTTYPPASDDFPNPERGFYTAKGYDPPERSPRKVAHPDEIISDSDSLLRG